MDISKLRSMKLEDFPLQANDKIRYPDTDRQGHVNNAVFNVFFETGRLEFLYHPKQPLCSPGCSFVIASAKIDYLKEITWPGTVHIGTVVTNIGNSSIHFAQGIYQNDLLVATAETVIVHVNNETKRSQALSEESKEVLLRSVLV
jgi:acyl-CoA thioester hydrolase